MEMVLYDISLLFLPYFSSVHYVVRAIQVMIPALSPLLLPAAQGSAVKQCTPHMLETPGDKHLHLGSPHSALGDQRFLRLVLTSVFLLCHLYSFHSISSYLSLISAMPCFVHQFPAPRL